MDIRNRGPNAQSAPSHKQTSAYLREHGILPVREFRDVLRSVLREAAPSDVLPILTGEWQPEPAAQQALAAEVERRVQSFEESLLADGVFGDRVDLGDLEGLLEQRCQRAENIYRPAVAAAEELERVPRHGLLDTLRKVLGGSPSEITSATAVDRYRKAREEELAAAAVLDLYTRLRAIAQMATAEARPIRAVVTQAADTLALNAATEPQPDPFRVVDDLPPGAYTQVATALDDDPQEVVREDALRAVIACAAGAADSDRKLLGATALVQALGDASILAGRAPSSFADLVPLLTPPGGDAQLLRARLPRDLQAACLRGSAVDTLDIDGVQHQVLTFEVLRQGQPSFEPADEWRHPARTPASADAQLFLAYTMVDAGLELNMLPSVRDSSPDLLEAVADHNPFVLTARAASATTRLHGSPPGSADLQSREDPTPGIASSASCASCGRTSDRVEGLSCSVHNTVHFVCAECDSAHSLSQLMLTTCPFLHVNSTNISRA